MLMLAPGKIINVAGLIFHFYEQTEYFFEEIIAKYVISPFVNNAFWL